MTDGRARWLSEAPHCFVCVSTHRHVEARGLHPVSCSSLELLICLDWQPRSPQDLFPLPSSKQCHTVCFCFCFLHGCCGYELRSLYLNGKPPLQPPGNSFCVTVNPIHDLTIHSPKPSLLTTITLGIAFFKSHLGKAFIRAWYCNMGKKFPGHTCPGCLS